MHTSFYRPCSDTYIDFPFDPAGMLIYSLGIFKLDAKTSVIECELNKNIMFSMNIGQVVGYTEGCEILMTLKISEQGDLIREPRNGDVKSNSGISRESRISQYEAFDKTNPPVVYDWVNRLLDKYENKEKLKPCR